jgi:CDP-diacylglycerol--glycerol-3-phosphate 3-phosphatidyltransferase
VNLPNNITLTRIAAIPLMLWVLRTQYLNEPYGAREIVAVVIFVLASITDGLDGYLARKRNQVTPLGMLLDPLADKLWITAGFVALVQFNPLMVPAWIAVVIIGREFLVSGLRSIAATQGFTIEASNLGKFKMVVQIIAICAAIMDRAWYEWSLGGFVFPVHWIAKVTIWMMVALSLYSAIDYFAAFWSKVAGTVEKRRRRRAFILSRRHKSGLEHSGTDDVAAG